MHQDEWPNLRPNLRLVRAPDPIDRVSRAPLRVVDDPAPRDARRSVVLERVNALLERRRAESVARENRRASRQPLAPHDARWRLATEAARALVGDRMPPESRRRLIAEGRRLGLGTFDANLVVAVVQHRARGGEPVAMPAPRARGDEALDGAPTRAEGLDPETSDRLALLAPPRRSGAGAGAAWRWSAWTIALAIIVGIACAGTIAWWIRGATTTGVLGVVDAGPRPTVTEPAEG